MAEFLEALACEANPDSWTTGPETVRHGGETSEMSSLRNAGSDRQQPLGSRDDHVPSGTAPWLPARDVVVREIPGHLSSTRIRSRSSVTGLIFLGPKLASHQARVRNATGCTGYAMQLDAQQSESAVLRRLMIIRTGTWMHAGVRKDIFSGDLRLKRQVTAQLGILRDRKTSFKTRRRIADLRQMLGFAITGLSLESLRNRSYRDLARRLQSISGATLSFKMLIRSDAAFETRGPTRAGIRIRHGFPHDHDRDHDHGQRAAVSSGLPGLRYASASAGTIARVGADRPLRHQVH